MMSLRKLVSLLVLCICCFACKKDRFVDSSGPDQVSLKLVQSAFSKINNDLPKQETGAPNAYYNLPDWKASTWEENEYGAPFWRIPLKSAATGERLIKIIQPYTGQEVLVSLPAPYLIAYSDSVSGIVFSVVQNVPYKDASPREKLGATVKYSGEVNLYEWNGKFRYGTRFLNGTRDKKITPTEGVGTNPAARAGSWECVNVTYCRYVASCTYYNSSWGAYFKEVSDRALGDQGFCFPPTHDAKDVLVALPPNFEYPDWWQWSCGNWNYQSTEYDVLCSWIEDPTNPNPNPNPSDPGFGYGGGFDQNGEPIIVHADPCVAKVSIQNYVNNTNIAGAIQSVKQASNGSALEWGTRIWASTVMQASSVYAEPPYSSQLNHEWKAQFQWQSGAYMLSTIHNHPDNTPPSPADIAAMVKGLDLIMNDVSYPNTEQGRADRAAHAMWYMENASVMVVSAAYDYVVYPKNWNTLWRKYSEYTKNSGVFDNKLIANENKHGDFLAGLLDTYEDGLSVYRKAFNESTFTPYAPNPAPIGAAVTVNCP